MNKQNLIFFLNIGLIICVFVSVFALPVFSVKAVSQYQKTTQSANIIQLEINKIKGEIIDTIGEMLDIIAEELEELILNFNQFFKLALETEEELENATSTATTTVPTATTTEEVDQSSAYVPDSTSEPQAPSVVCDPVAYGRQTYNVSTKKIPKISQIVVDPLDLSFNSAMEVTANINDTNNNPITSVTGLASTDTRTTPFTLSLSSGTTTSGTWQGSWTLKDSICRNFMVTITATSNSGTSKIDVTFR